LFLQVQFPLHLAQYLIIDLALVSQPDHGSTFSLNDLAMEPTVRGHLLFMWREGSDQVFGGMPGLLLIARTQVREPRLRDPLLPGKLL